MIVNFEPPREILTLEAQLVGLDRIELSTPRLSSACSNQLSYTPRRPAVAIADGQWPIAKKLVELRRLELLTYSLQSYRSTN